MNNLCKELTFYKKIIPKVKPLLNQIKRFTSLYNDLKDIYDLDDLGFHSIISKEYISNHDLIDKFEEIFGNENIKQVMTICSSEMIEEFQTSQNSNYCSKYEKLDELIQLIKNIIETSDEINQDFIDNGSENDSLIGNYSDISTKGNLFIEVLNEKIEQAKDECSIDSKFKFINKKNLFILGIVITVLLLILIFIQIAKKKKQINAVITGL